MLFSFYSFLFIGLLIIGFAIILLILRGKNSRTGLYCEGVRNENDGHYNLALHNYEDALDEIRTLYTKRSLARKIAARIKILRTTIEYEKNFQVGVQAGC